MIARRFILRKLPARLASSRDPIPICPNQGIAQTVIMDKRPAFGPADERFWDQDVTLSWDQERWPTRRGWALALGIIALIPALAYLPISFIFFGSPAFLGFWHVLRGHGPLVTAPGRASLRLAPERLTYDVVRDNIIVTHFEMDRDDAGALERRMMDKASTALTVRSRDGREIELGDRRLEPRVEGRHMLLSTWLASWWPDETSWREVAGPGGLTLLDASRSSDSRQARRLRLVTGRLARLAGALWLIVVAWYMFLEPEEDIGGTHLRFPLGEGRLDESTLIGLIAVICAVILILWPTITGRRSTRVASPRITTPGAAMARHNASHERAEHPDAVNS